MNHDRFLDISWGTILKIALAFLGFYLIYLVRDVLVWIIFALIISVLFNPAISFLQKRRIPRILATLLTYVGIFGIFAFFIYLVVPSFAFEIGKFFKSFPQYFESIVPILKNVGLQDFENLEDFANRLAENPSDIFLRVFSVVSFIFGGIFSTITIFAIAIFLSLEERGVERVIGLVSPKKYETYILSLWERSQVKVARWFGARLLTAFSVGLMTFIACKVLAIEYASSFGLLAGILDIVPIIGPIIAGFIIIVFTLLDSWTNALFFLIAFILIQQIEGNILTPILTKKLVGLPPVLVLISLMIGAKLLGILGAILAIPLAGIIFEFLRDFLRKRKEERATVF